MKLTEEKDGEFIFNVPECPKCKLIMSGFFYKFYKDPTFSQTEVLSAFFWVEVWFQCPKCFGKAFLSKEELEIMNSYPMDKINFPPGFDKKNMKIQRLTSK